MTDDKAIQKIENELAPDVQWRDIINRIVDEMGEGELPDDVVRCTELLICGWPTYKAARELSVSPQTIRRWLEKYPSMALAVAHGRKLMTQWRMSKLEQQFLTAVEKSEEILNLDLTDSSQNAKLIAAVAQQARYIIGLFAGQRVDVNVNVSGDGTLFKAQQDALDYIAQKVQEQRNSGEVIEATYRVVDADEASQRAPLLDENGNPPFGTLGEFDTTSEGTLCHICGERSKSLKKHIGLKHKMNEREYTAIYMLPKGAFAELNQHDPATQ